MNELFGKESAQAIGKVADTAAKGIDAGREFGGFFSRHFGGTVEQWAGLWEDKLKYRRWENQLALMLKAEEKIKSLGLEGKLRPLEMKIGVPLLEAASLEEDDYLRERWSELLITAVTDIGPTVEVALIDILRNFSPVDAYVLDALYTYKEENDLKLNRAEEEQPFDTLPRHQQEERQYERRMFAYSGEENLDQGKKVHASLIANNIKEKHGKAFMPEQVEAALFNLYRLNCIHLTQVMGGWPSPEHIYFLHLGETLHKACTLKELNHAPH